jgi:sterol desaturase/sphingolipid hydroxylase (fatty acid hydroxylase superfamily)
MSLAAFIAMAIAGGLGMYFGICGFLEFRYYRRRREAADWKIQPARWPTPAARRREIALGTANLIGASILSGWFAHYVASGGYSSIYFDVDRYGFGFAIATTVIYFVGTDGLLYGAHRLLHRKTLFRNIHRVHHRWTSPTAFTSMAMHPVEFALYQSIMVVPLFFLPIHVIGLATVLVYQNSIAMLDHSGIQLTSLVPWQPPPRFHDDHHAHFHVNYGQTLGVWDRLFGTWRRSGRRYGEDVFGGKGAPIGAAGESATAYVDYRAPAVLATSNTMDVAP